MREAASADLLRVVVDVQAADMRRATRVTCSKAEAQAWAQPLKVGYGRDSSPGLTCESWSWSWSRYSIVPCCTKYGNWPGRLSRARQ